MTLGSTQPLTEMSIRTISTVVKAAGAWGWQLYQHPVPLSWNLGTSTSRNPPNLSRPVMGLLYLYVRVHIQLPCVPNRPWCFRIFGIQRHIVWRIEQQQWRTQEFCSGGIQQIHLWTEYRPLPLPLYFTKKDAIRVLCLFHLDVSCGEMLGLIQSQEFHWMGCLITRLLTEIWWEIEALNV